jgi:hypothetical protein
VHVIVTSVNPIEGLVDLALVEIDAPANRRPQRSPARAAQAKQPQRDRSGKRGRSGK